MATHSDVVGIDCRGCEQVHFLTRLSVGFTGSRCVEGNLRPQIGVM